MVWGKVLPISERTSGQRAGYSLRMPPGAAWLVVDKYSEDSANCFQFENNVLRCHQPWKRLGEYY